MKRDVHSKTTSIRAHARRRFLERAGVLMTRALKRDLIRKIQSAEAEFIARQSNRITLWSVDVAGSVRTVVYDKNRKEIVTILPEGSHGS